MTFEYTIVKNSENIPPPHQKKKGWNPNRMCNARLLKYIELCNSPKLFHQVKLSFRTDISLDRIGKSVKYYLFHCNIYILHFISYFGASNKFVKGLQFSISGDCVWCIKRCLAIIPYVHSAMQARSLLFWQLVHCVLLLLMKCKFYHQ